MPEQPGPMPVAGPGHPLALGRRTRTRLRRAIRRLLADPGLADAPDSVRLAAVVLAAKTWEKSGWSQITSRELGRWIGLSQSRTASGVLPVLRGSGVARTQVRTLPGSEKMLGLRCAVVPLWAGRGVAGDDLALTRGELATLLRLVEACFAPGWRKGSEDWSTAPGLLGTGSGATSASDRLALLLLVLECGSQGRVKLCGGRADERHGRSATTLSRLMGCTPSRAARILARLEEQGLVDRRRVKTASGLHHKARLLVPAVAAAHGASVPADVEETAREQAVVAAEAAVADPAPAAGVGQPPADDVSVQVTDADVAGVAEVSDPAPAAHLHTDHSLVAGVVGDACAVDGSSGEAVVGAGRLRPERAGVREEAVDRAGEGPRLTVVDGEGGPLRGEQPKTERRGGKPGRESAGQERGVAQIPPDLAVALAPVIGLWWRVKRRGERAVVVAAARRELAAVADRTDPSSAPGLLAERLAFRLGRQGALDSVRDPVGWLLKRGLPQGRQCGDVRCDDGTLLTDGSVCPRCEDNRVSRRRERQQVLEDVYRQLPHATEQERRDAVEQRMRELAGIAAELQQIRLERAAAAPAWWECSQCERPARSTPPPSGVCRECQVEMGEGSR
ncbi:hypothetical protein ACEZCY_36030 [Streptacidiphilus sp. N1-12]|uniref:MarR family protein n=1 Tax=Streptacidiphilus alkalitolerans TaxID=3342712 RepID=A0ABV6WRB6_9ACTN